MFKDKFGSRTRKTFNKFTTTGSYTWNMKHNTENIAVWNLNPERWASPLVQKKYHEENACDRRQKRNNNVAIRQEDSSDFIMMVSSSMKIGRLCLILLVVIYTHGGWTDT
jgi:hypothetical protein